MADVKMEKLPLRARLGLYVLIFMLKVIGPTERASEIKEISDKLEKEIAGI